MGGPLSALLSEVYMQHYDIRSITNNNTFSRCILDMWTFIVPRGTKREYGQLYFKSR